MYKNMLSLFGAFALAVVSSTVFSATVTLDPGSLTVTPNQTFTVDIRLNVDPASEFGIPASAVIYSGDVKIQYIGTDLTLNGFALDSAQPGAASFNELSKIPGTSLALRFDNIAFTGNSGGVIGSYSFTGNNFSGVSDLVIADDNSGGSFVVVDTNNAVSSFNPTAFTGATISAVPVPAAAWLMLSGLGLFGFSVRRK